MGNNVNYLNEFLTFDIETTTIITDFIKGQIQYEGIVWSGQFFDGENYIQVRDLKGIRETFATYADQIKPDDRMLVFVHNLSYEFQFIKNFFHWTKIIAYSPRKIISAECEEGFIFRCSYVLSNMSLEMFLKQEQVEVQKTHMDYSIRRLPSTPLSESEKEYCKADVVGLHQAISKRIEQCWMKSIRYLPLTSTGYVRKECKKAMGKNKQNRYRFFHDQLSYEQFKMCQEAFRGGNVHANRYYAGKVLTNIFSVDKASSYPFELMTKEYPTKFYKMKKHSKSEFYGMIHRGFAVLFRAVFKDVRIKQGVFNPYISASKCYILATNSKEYTGHTRDNGRILTADYLAITLTEIDFKIIESQYDWSEMRLRDVFYAQKAPVSEELKAVCRKYFQLKTELKEVDKRSDQELTAAELEKRKDREYLYNKSKAYINSIYGMTVTSPVKDHYTYHAEGQEIIADQDQEAEALKLHKFYKNHNSFLDYQIGIWLTAYARAGYQEMVDIMGKDFAYGDTDSCKGFNYAKYKDKIEEVNERIRQEAIDNEAFAYDANDNIKYMGVWEFEGISKYFKTFGSKKYLYGDDSDFKITIAGVPKKDGKNVIKNWVNDHSNQLPYPAWYNIDIGFEFPSIKLASQYHDYLESKYINVEGETIEVSSNLGLFNVNYKLGYASDYEKLLRLCNEKVEGENYE